MAKRKIILGFEEPSKLEEDTIYVTFIKDYSGEDILANIHSNAEFKFEDESGEHKGIYVASGKYYYKLSNSKILNNLAEFNNGILDYSRLIDEGAGKY